MEAKVDRSAMRIASSPNARIAAGLLLAVLLSVVGYQVVLRLNSQGPEALLKRADGFVWLVRVDLTRPSCHSREQKIHSRCPARDAVAAHLRSEDGDSKPHHRPNERFYG